MKDKIYLSTPHMGGFEEQYVAKAFRSNWVAPLGPNVTAFELALEKYLDEDVHIAALSSGTAAIHLALLILGVGSEDEVLCQSMTFAASANPIIYVGATPVFVDSEPETWNMCPQYLEEAIIDRISKGKKPKAIIAVHLFGMPYKVEELKEVSRKYEIPIIEDAAEALGSSYKNQKCGTFGDLAILSFNGNKIITTSGGGALVCKNLSQKQEAIFLATQARDNAPHYEHSRLGYNYRLSNISAGIGRGQMKVIDNHIQKRRDMHQFYLKLFKPFPEIEVFSEPNDYFYSNHWLSCITFKNSYKNSQELREFLLNENIETRPLWKPMHLQPVFKNAPYYGGSTSEELFEIGLCLPSGSKLTNEEKSRIADGILDYLKL